MRLRRPVPLPGAVIALTPLIDVVFILLIFFMLASRFDLWNGFSLALGPPEKAVDAAGRSAGETTNDRSVVSIVLLSDNRVSLAGRPATMEEVRVLARETGDSAIGRAITFSISAEQGASVAALVALLEDLKAAGAADIQLAMPAAGESPG